MEKLRFYKVDLCDMDAFETVLKESPSKFTACIHFAGLKAVGESVEKPLLYYKNNLLSTINLLELLDKYDCHSLVFSSSATVRRHVQSQVVYRKFPNDRYTAPQKCPLQSRPPQVRVKSTVLSFSLTR